MQNPALDIVIVNWNSGEQLQECLRSLAGTDEARSIISKVVVVDNASTDNSLAQIFDLDLPLQLVENTTNRGFGAACNIGARLGSSEYILFLNPDTILQSDSITAPLSHLRLSMAQVGICGIQLFDENNEISRTCARFPTPRIIANELSGLSHILPRLFPSKHLKEWDHSNSQVVDHVMGAFYLIRRSIFDELNGFDERFFVYLEDLDLSYRAAIAGWKTYYYTNAQAFHKGGGCSEQVKAARLSYSLESRTLYCFKHFSGPTAVVLLVATLTVEPFARLAEAVLKRSWPRAKETVLGYRIFVSRLRSAFGRMHGT